MRLLIDGPQGTGKTTLCHILRDNHGYTHQRWDATTLMTEDALASYTPDDNIIHERGWTSEFVYNTLWNLDKTNITLNQFHTLLDNLDHCLIIGTQKPELLEQRISQRREETGRIVPDNELNVLRASIHLFNGLGHMLKDMAPHKVTLINAEDYNNPPAFTNYLLTTITA